MPQKTLWIGRLDDFAEGLAELRQTRDEFVRRLEQLPDEAIARPAHHPRLDQPMRILDLMIFAAEHDDHHLARISEIMRTHEPRSS